MPWNQVMDKFKSGGLHSGSASGPVVTNPKQAVAIKSSEKDAAANGKSEYKASPSHPFMKVKQRKMKGGR